MNRRGMLFLVPLVAFMAAACIQSQPTAVPRPVAERQPATMPTPSSAPSPTATPAATVTPTAVPAPTVTATVAPAAAPIPVPRAPTPTSQTRETPTPAATPVPDDTPTPPPIPPPTPVPTPTLDPFQALALMIQQVRPSVVRVESDLGTGSGVIFETSFADGSALVLTNYHVIEGARRVRAVVNDASPFAAVVWGVDAVRDLAVLQICCYGQFRAVPLSNAQATIAGTELIVMGYPYSLQGQATVTRGIVSAVRYEDDNRRWVIQTDAPINPGNSGGPMFSSSGEVVGITTFKYRSVGGGTAAEGLGFAVSGQTIAAVLPNLKGGPALALPIGTPPAAVAASPPVAATPTPYPAIVSAAAPTEAPRFTITINGVPVGPEERVVTAPFGQIKLSIPPEEDGTYIPGTVVTLTVFSNIDDLILRWSGVDLPRDRSAIVQMFEDKIIRVRVGGY